MKSSRKTRKNIKRKEKQIVDAQKTLDKNRNKIEILKSFGLTENTRTKIKSVSNWSLLLVLQGGTIKLLSKRKQHYKFILKVLLKNQFR